MRKYAHVFAAYFRTQLVWRFDVITNVLFAFFRVVLALILWRAVFEGHETVAGYTLSQMLTYYIVITFLSQANLSGSMASEIGDRIKGGTFSGRMVIPVNVKGYFYAQTLGAAAFQTLLAAAAACVCLPLLSGSLAFACTARQACAAALLAAMGLAFMLQMHFGLGILAFKYTEVWVFLMIKNNILSVISGEIIPLALLPAQLLGALRLLPFYYTSYLPAQLMLGKGGDEALLGILVLLIWNLAMALVNHFAYARLRTRYDGVGI